MACCMGYSAFVYIKTIPNNVDIITQKRRSLRLKCKCTSSSSSSVVVERRSANYTPSSWNHQYLLSLHNIYANGREVEKRAKLLKEEVRNMLNETEGSVEKLDLIDTLQRLGISYHFNYEIHHILTTIHNAVKYHKLDNKDLHATALEFRLLRQHGFNVSQDVFSVFMDESGALKEGLENDVEGLLSLYEASYLSTEMDTKLKEIRYYAREQLTKIASKYENENETYISAAVMRALEMPYHWSVRRLEARWHVDMYGKRLNMNPLLLEFSKLDFNILQSVHQEELKLISSWWEKRGLMKHLDFARDRITESYFWSVGVFYEPQFSYFRQILTKVFMIITTIDDVYDIYGTLEELESFTDAIHKWDVNLVEGLPEYMKLCFLFVYNETNQIGYDVMRDKGFNVIPWLKKSWADLFKIFLVEAKWFKSGYKPKFLEYMQNGWISSSVPTILLHLFCVFSDQLSDQTLTNVSYHNPVVRASSTVLRLANDLATSSEELARGDSPKSIQCYMYETGASESEAREHAQQMISVSWDDMNFAKTTCSSSLPLGFMEAAANLARTVQCTYQYGDGHGYPDKAMTFHRVTSVLLDPVPLD